MVISPNVVSGYYIERSQRSQLDKITSWMSRNTRSTFGQGVMEYAQRQLMKWSLKGESSVMTRVNTV